MLTGIISIPGLPADRLGHRRRYVITAGRQSLLLSHCGVTVDLAAQRAERDGHRLNLTAKEQALLVLFLRHPGEVLSRTRIYEQVWDERYDGLSNTLEVHIMELRRKLEAHGPRVIHTLRGRGYIFNAASSSETL